MARPVPVLKRFDRYFYKNRASGDLAQVPASGAILSFYAQGATVKLTTNLAPTGLTTIPVFHTGMIAVGDSLLVEGPTVKDAVVVTAVDATAGTVTIEQLGLDFPPTSAQQGVRLIAGSRHLQVFADPLGMTGGAATLITDGAGRARCYIREFRFDYTVTIGATVPIVFADAEGSFVMRS